MSDSLFILAEQLVYCCFILLGLSLLWQTKAWLGLTALLAGMEDKTLASVLLGVSIICLPVGLFLVWVHNEWIMGYSVIVTIVGWIVCVKASCCLLFPNLAARLTKRFYKGGDACPFLKWYIKGCGGLYILLGVLVYSTHW